MSIPIRYCDLPGAIAVENIGYAWEPKNVLKITELAAEKSWMVLGGDILTLTKNFTYDNWYFIPDPFAGVGENVNRSIQKCLLYIEEYGRNHGENVLVALVLSDAYVGTNT